MQRFLVYFEQVNQTMYDVTAESEEAAVKKARREWKADNGQPHPIHVEHVPMQPKEPRP